MHAAAWSGIQVAKRCTRRAAGGRCRRLSHTDASTRILLGGQSPATDRSWPRKPPVGCERADSLRMLSAYDRTLLEDRLIEQLTLEQLSCEQGCDPRTIGKRVKKAIEKLRSAVVDQP